MPFRHRNTLIRSPALPHRIATWSLISFHRPLVKAGSRLVKHARYYGLFLAESYLTWQLFGATVGRIYALPPSG